MRERILIACCTSGLANRLLMIVGAERVARLTERKLLVYWPENDQLDCSFDKLFQNRFDMLRDSDMHSLLRSDRAMRVYNARECAPLYQEISPEADAAADIVLVKGWTAPKFANETLASIRDELCEGLLRLEPRADLLTAASELALPEHCLGMHVRHGETWKYVDPAVQSKWEHFETLADAVLQSAPSAAFGLATTQPDVEEKFRARFGERMIFLPKSSRGRDTTAIREALIDLLLLSRTRAVVGTFGSTFSQVAAMLGPRVLITANAAAVTTHLEANTRRLVSVLKGSCEPHLDL